MVKRLWEGVNGWNQQPKWSRVRLPTSEVKSFFKKIKEDFRTRLPPFDRRMGLVGELFVLFLPSYYHLMSYYIAQLNS